MSNRRIGIMGAMKEETALLLSAMENPSTAVHGGRSDVNGLARSYHSGRLYGRDAVLVFSRWGKAASASTVTTLIERYEVDFVVFTGVAGALKPDLNLGDVVVGDEFVQYDLDARPMFARFELPLPDLKVHVAALRADPQAVSDALASANEFIEMRHWDVSVDELENFGITAPKARAGLIASGDTFVHEAQHANELRSMLPNTECVEMEGAAVAQICWEHNVPLAVLRVISDKADHAAPTDFQRFVTGIASHFTAGVVRRLIARA